MADSLLSPRFPPMNHYSNQFYNYSITYSPEVSCMQLLLVAAYFHMKAVTFFTDQYALPSRE